ncbi:hypothetical protein BJ138DRAFT_1143990 [Hygrophoropsis aurantiaca]|uniref:Uncharacterized protein n=1 Tax=Hygrophoropsis aurantiaca TaxID=72124 RepID=A0ACB8AMN8_9AGAM|nr:hypothetical protein BJ138DRAFT_1143990 [Hygrophoropsis aurantiaca]
MYHSDGRRRSRPKASTLHGWLVKWRATFSGNEALRKEGMREMKEAKLVRQWKQQRKATRKHSENRGPLAFLGLGKKKKHPRRPSLYTRSSSRHSSKKSGSSRALVTKPPTPSRKASEKRPPAVKRPSGHSSRHPSYNSRMTAAKPRPPRK